MLQWIGDRGEPWLLTPWRDTLHKRKPQQKKMSRIKLNILKMIFIPLFFRTDLANVCV